MMATMRGYDSVIDHLLDEQDEIRIYDRQIRMPMTDWAPGYNATLPYTKLLAKNMGIFLI